MSVKAAEVIKVLMKMGDGDHQSGAGSGNGNDRHRRINTRQKPPRRTIRIPSSPIIRAGCNLKRPARTGRDRDGPRRSRQDLAADYIRRSRVASGEAVVLLSILARITWKPIAA